jgi:cell division protein ZipA
MAWLRLILLLAGVLFIGLLMWWERRRQRQAAQPSPARGERSEPTFDAGGEAKAGQGAELAAGEPVSAPPARERESRRMPPVIDWSDAAATTDVDSPPSAAQVSPERGGAMVAAPAALPELPPLVVDWPPENDRRIVTLRIIPARQDRLAGRALRQGLTGCGFRHGQFGIFHLPLEDGRVVLSAASLVRPGMLDPTTMDFQRFSGINLFAVLPGPLSPEATLERLAAAAVELAARVEGRVQDENGVPLGPAEIAAWRQRCLRPFAAASAAGGAGGAGAAAAGAGQAD